MDVQVENHQSVLPVNLDTIKPIVEAVLMLENSFCCELMIYFVDVETICKLHQQHFDDPTETDCISIQVDPPNKIPSFLGEIFISPQAAIDYCKSNSLQAYEELTLYLVHGLLHLLGYDDREIEQQEKMRLAEKKCMDYLLENKKIIS